MEKYLYKIQPNISCVWRTDELYLKVKVNMENLYALMDNETRFWVAQEDLDTKHMANIIPLFKHGKDVTGKRSNTLISDGAPNFNDAFKKEFYTNANPKTRHIRHIRLQGDKNNNKMERFNEVREREKVMRGLKRADTQVLTGYRIYHNYMYPHEALKGETSAENCGIRIKGQNKWLTLIQNGALVKWSIRE
jgi:putative transposase